MGEHNSRFLGVVSNSGGTVPSISHLTTSFGNSNFFVPYSHSRETSFAVTRSSLLNVEGCNRDSSGSWPDPRFLLASISGNQENGGFSTGHRSVYPEHLSDYSPFQNGNESLYQTVHPSWYVGYQSGSNRRIFPHSHSSFLQEVPSICVGQCSVSVSSTSFRPLYCSSGFHQNFSNSNCSFTLPVYSDSFISRRFPSQEFLSFYFRDSYKEGNQALSSAGFSNLLEKVGDSSFPKFHISRGEFQNRSRDSSTPSGKISVSLPENSFYSNINFSNSQTVLSTSGLS